MALTFIAVAMFAILVHFFGFLISIGIGVVAFAVFLLADFLSPN